MWHIDWTADSLYRLYNREKRMHTLKLLIAV